MAVTIAVCIFVCLLLVPSAHSAQVNTCRATYLSQLENLTDSKRL